MQLTATCPSLNPLQNTQSWVSLKMTLVINTPLPSQPVGTNCEQPLQGDSLPPHCWDGSDDDAVRAKLSPDARLLCCFNPISPRTDARGKLREAMSLLVLPACASTDHFPTPAWRCPCSHHQWSPKPRCSHQDVPARRFSTLTAQCSDGSMPLQHTRSQLSQPQVSHLPSADVL